MENDMAELFETNSSDSDSEPEYKYIDVNGFHLRQMGKHHSLWGELVWITGRIASKHILAKDNEFNVEGKTVVEFGSGVGLCAVSAAVSGAKNVVATDYNERVILETLEYNTKNYPNIKVVGHSWGNDVTPVLEANNGEKFDIAILCDLVFNHSGHKPLLKSLKACLKPDGKALVAHSHHVPHLAQNDLNFFQLAEEKFGFKVEIIGIEKHPPMFPNDTGDIELRTHCYLKLMTFK
ncbi:membrane protein, putative [Trichomonas vaginalis G3]|uniref:Membrane protein, putative n=1 Tax=Trichomonas vaginalis (strain ATCC PRA-98 / G3) TaxID=412133 RepID=A2FYV2_TRIV3|nr:uncharacterized protein TVAGG3_0416440 [Trichomonas vaginalis G3]EAX89914.1 membrane protein, putative [Trichomonas vaginalis G3]KAI5535739.1 methyltransferase protein [Trichomonas vaginalis G3]|eukprot:XP_001302844.1 hypothetical protein [Trichomonas vaginalis G3]